MKLCEIKQFILKWIGDGRQVLCSTLILVIMMVLVTADHLLTYSDILSMNLFGWAWVLMSAFPWAIAGLIPLWVLGGYSRYLYVPFFLSLFVVEGVEWFVLLNFNMLIDGDLVGIIAGSSWNEMMWFVKQYFGFHTILVIGVIVAVVYGFARIIILLRDFRVNATTLGFAFFALCVFVYGSSIMNNGLDVFDKRPTLHMISDSIGCFHSFTLLAEMKKHPCFPMDIHVSSETDEVVGVFVLGESATRSHWGLYGYDRDTTPNMSRRKDELVRFDDLVTPAGTTAESMRYLFTTRTVESDDDLRYTMSQALRRAGFEVSCFSNQSRWGKWDGEESFDFADCEPMEFMDEIGETNKYDEVLIKHLERTLNQDAKRQVVFLHLAGGHAPCVSGYPHQGALFPTETEEEITYMSNPKLSKNHYDNCIWYTDKILESVIQLLEQKGKPCWLVYLSDHGETPSAQSWRTATDRDLWDVPFVIWMSKAFTEKYPDRVSRLTSAKARELQTDQLFYGLLDFAGVEGLDVPPEANFLEEEFCPRKPRLILGGNGKYIWDK